jgi:hypothetical protein
MESQHKINSFNIVKAISGEICLDYTNTNNYQKNKNLLIKTKNKKKNKPKKEKENINTITIATPKKKREKKEFIPLPLINNNSNNNNSAILFSHYHNNKNSFKISKSNSFSYINENIKKTSNTNTNINTNYYLDYLDNYEDKNTQMKITQSVNQFLSNNFICKKHINREYSAYCSRCKENICRECILDDLNHMRHKIYNWKDIIPTDFKISYYQK